MTSTIEIFFCYAREDEELRNRLEKQLRALRRQGLIDVWHDREISAGTEWEREIDKHLNSAQIILLLVSPDFMDSDYCYSKEMIQAMERHERGEARVIPIILRSVYWEGAPFGKLQALPTDAKAVTSPSWYNLDEAFFDVAKGILKAANELLKDRLLNEGYGLYKTEQYEGALVLYERIIRLDPKSIDAHKGEGDALYRLGRNKEALAAYEQVIRLDPNDATIYNRKGMVLEQMQLYQEALSAYEQAIRLNPSIAVVYYNRGNVLNRLNRHNEALEAYKQAIKLNPKVGAYFNGKGKTLYELNRYRDALVAYEQAIELEPNNTLYRNNRDSVLKRLPRILSLAVSSDTNPGISRRQSPNEDSIFAMEGSRVGTQNSLSQPFGLFVVADGGVTFYRGAAANVETRYGQEASCLAIQASIDYILPKFWGTSLVDNNTNIQILIDGVQRANQAVHENSKQRRAYMGATMAAVLVVGFTAYVANVGHSRVYLYREPQGLSKITLDHSIAASLVDAGYIKPDDIYTHPGINLIYRSLGEKPTVEIDSFQVPLQKNDKLLLCTQGLWTMVREPVIEQIMRTSAINDPSKISRALIKAAFDGGGEDNVSVIVVSIPEKVEQTGLTGIQLLAKPETVTVPDFTPI